MPAPSSSPVSVAQGTVLFEDSEGSLHITVIVKATYALRHRALAEPAPSLPLFEDAYRENGGRADRPRSLHAASDLVPWKQLADVVVVGRFHPRRGGMTRQVVGISLARGPDVILQKHIVAVGERSQAESIAAPLAVVPLAWEMTWAGRDNPLAFGPGTEKSPGSSIPSALGSPRGLDPSRRSGLRGQGSSLPSTRRGSIKRP